MMELVYEIMGGVAVLGFMICMAGLAAALNCLWSWWLESPPSSRLAGLWRDSRESEALAEEVER